MSLNPESAASKNRKKVALKPGHSLMDWVRLCSSGKDLTGTGGTYVNINANQLANHNSVSDAWLAISGVVFNVTEYMAFHPGGQEELMRGVGMDCTKLFNQVHPWVNYESLLRCCIVGRLRNFSSLPPSPSYIRHNEEPIIDKKGNLTTQFRTKLTNTLVISNVETKISTCKMDWYQQLSLLCIVFYMKMVYPNSRPIQVCVWLVQNNQLMLSIDDITQQYQLEDDIRWPCNIKIMRTNVEIRLTKEKPKIWINFGNKSEKCHYSFPSYCKMKIVHSQLLTQDTKLIAVQYTEHIMHYIHIGHHVKFKDIVNGEEIERSYTPVSLLLPEDKSLQFDGYTLYFIIKSYNEGTLSNRLCSYSIGNTIDMSAPTGSFDTELLRNRNCLILLAAGTGITPMISLIMWALKTTKSNIKLLFFNKTEGDIIWRDEMDTICLQNSRFCVKHVLSQMSDTWKGDSGTVNAQLIQSVVSETTVQSSFICLCGPNIFVNLCESFIQQIGYTEKDYHCFLG